MNSHWHRSSLFLCLLIFALTFVAFHETLENDFVNWDDPDFICQNPRIQTLDWAHIHEMFTSFEAGAYTPLSQLSLGIDHALWKDNAAGFHLTALLLHCLNGCLVFFLARHLIQKSGSLIDNERSMSNIHPSSARIAEPGFILHPSSLILPEAGALVAALLFSLHPLRVESVAWASERRDVLSTFLGLSCALAYVRYVQALTWRWFLAMFILFVCAVISKAVVVTLPLVFLLLDIHPFRRFSFSHSFPPKSGLVRSLCEKLPLLLVSLTTGLVLMNSLLHDGLANGVKKAGLESRIAQSCVANLFYLQKMIVPWNLNPLNKSPGGFHFHQPMVWAGLAIAALITLILIRFRSRFPSALVAWFSYLLLISPFLGLAASGLQLTADRYTYLSSVPLCILLGGAFHWVWKGRLHLLSNSQFSILNSQLLMTLTTFFILISFGYLTHQQTRIWKDSETLWKHSLQLDKYSPVALNNLGDAMAAKNDHEEAIQYFKKAIDLTPSYTDAWYNLGNELYRLERYPEAAKAYQKTLFYDPTHARAHHNLGWIFAHLHDLESALRHYEAAEKLNPSPATEYNIACCLKDQGDTQGAVRYFRAAAGQGFAEAWIGWSELVAAKSDPSGAIAILKEGVRHTDNSRVQFALADAILNQPRLSKGDLALARQILIELDRKTGGKSEKVQNLIAKLHAREIKPP